MSYKVENLTARCFECSNSTENTQELLKGDLALRPLLEKSGTYVDRAVAEGDLVDACRFHHKIFDQESLGVSKHQTFWVYDAEDRKRGSLGPVTVGLESAEFSTMDEEVLVGIRSQEPIEYEDWMWEQQKGFQK